MIFNTWENWGRSGRCYIMMIMYLPPFLPWFLNNLATHLLAHAINNDPVPGTVSIMIPACKFEVDVYYGTGSLRITWAARCTLTCKQTMHHKVVQAFPIFVVRIKAWEHCHCLWLASPIKEITPCLCEGCGTHASILATFTRQCWNTWPYVSGKYTTYSSEALMNA